MKKSFNRKNHFIASCDMCRKLMTLSLMLIFFAVLPSVSITAQTVVNTDAFADDSDFEPNIRLSQLTSGLHPSVYIANGEISKFGPEVPRVVFSDAASTDMLYQKNSAFMLVELVRIRLSAPGEDQFVLDVDQLQSFSNLKFILFEFGYDHCGGETEDCLAELVKRMVKFGETPVMVAFNLSIPE